MLKWKFYIYSNIDTKQHSVTYKSTVLQVLTELQYQFICIMYHKMCDHYSMWILQNVTNKWHNHFWILQIL